MTQADRAPDISDAALAFVLLRPTPLLNVTLRQHWSARRRTCVALAWEIKVALGVRRPPAPFPRARLRIERYSIRTPDYDGMVGGYKALIDCLLPYHPKRRPYGLDVIADDNPGVLVADYPPPFLVRRAAEQRTVVVIVPLPVEALDPPASPHPQT